MSEMPRALARETVLVVDDEPLVSMLIIDVLEDLGYAAIEAPDSASGLKVLQSDSRIDLLITDIGLPGGMNGSQLAEAARRHRPDLKVLFVTGYAETGALGRDQLASGMKVLTKPFSIDMLTTRIKSMLDGS
jgi:CheY-like chemotaxis protein